jgi:hypothetical protein
MSLDTHHAGARDCRPADWRKCKREFVREARVQSS